MIFFDDLHYLFVTFAEEHTVVELLCLKFTYLQSDHCSIGDCSGSYSAFLNDKRIKNVVDG